MIEGVQILREDVPNQTGCIHPLSALEHCVERSKQGPIYGTFMQPASVELDHGKLSHQVHNLRIVDGYLIGDIELLDTVYGRALSEVVDTCAFSTFSMVKFEGEKISDLKLITIQATTRGVAP